MARKDKNRQTAEERKTAQDYYKLHSGAVNDLVTANEENSPVVSEAELRKYRSGPKFKLSETIKALLVKYWFNGSVCFFFFLGLGNYLRDILDQLCPEKTALQPVCEYTLRFCRAVLCLHVL